MTSMLDLVEKMASSGNKVLESAANDFSKWKKLKHNKQDLELFLQFNLVHLRFRPKGKSTFKDIVCTSNTRFIKVFSMLRESQKKRALSTKFDGIKTKDKDSVLTYNLLEGKYNTVDLGWWELVAFITMSEDNIEVLDKVANEMLKRNVIKDISESKAKKVKK